MATYPTPVQYAYRLSCIHIHANYSSQAFALTEEELRILGDATAIQDVSFSGSTCCCAVLQVSHGGFIIPDTLHCMSIHNLGIFILLCLHMYIQGSDVIIANLGDTRAILGSRARNGIIEVQQLSTEHRPDNEDEKGVV